MGSIQSSLRYDLGAICDSGDVSIAVAYQPLTELVRDTNIILKTEFGSNEDGLVVAQYLTAVIQKADVSAPEKGDTAYYAATDTTYKVLEIIADEDAFVRAVVESI